jgi:hypothetical protein
MSNIEFNSHRDVPARVFETYLVSRYIFGKTNVPFTYDHRILNSALPVRSAVLKQDTGGLVVRWVTTSESPLLYIFVANSILTRNFLNHHINIIHDEYVLL